ncbi:PepSY-associated TM helix domain-containing protein [Methylomonas sp. LL1]|uniref:PepSY-associated TM helix domain-containing protein n=1 Tax=Methylomonas sp. LL1 TaxID=2785785 RepID=UPI0018C3A119|nr:PepSY-associated TM helix domain-containing protein [Methylomonas sp. LL1]QPK61501.1 PepSY-associated TM helix domain-containing protein [Methylomonas sp. LL1]
MNTSIHAIQPAKRPPKTNGGYLFLPKSLARGTFLKWLRRTHAWFGLWGAALGLLFGFSGILLNHREVMKIPIGKMEQKQIQLALPEPRPADPKAMAAWLGASLGINTANAKIRSEPAKTVIWNNQPIQQPASWQINLRNPQRMLSAEYWEGNAFVSVKQGEGNLLSMLTNLHKGSGMGVGWILLADSLAGGLMFLSLTGILLWTRLHGKRLAAAGLGLSSLSLSVFLALQAIAG